MTAWALLVVLGAAPTAAPPAADLRLDAALDGYLRTHDAEALKTALSDAARAAPSNPTPHYHLGSLALHERRWADAASSYRRFLELSPPSALEKVVRGEVALLERAAAQPNPKAQAALVYDLLLNQAKEAFRLGGFEAAGAQAAEAASLVPERYDAWWLLGSLYERAGALDDALAHLGRALERLDQPDLRPGLEASALRVKRALRGAAEARRAAQAHGADRHAEAGWAFARAATLTNRPELELTAALALAAAGEPLAAREHLDRAEASPALASRVAETRRRIPSLTPLLSAAGERAARQGRAAMDRGDFKAAVTAFEQASRATPTCESYRVAWAEALAASGDGAGAERLLATLEQPSPLALEALAAARVQLERWEGAATAAKAALAARGEDARLLRLLGQAWLGAQADQVGVTRALDRAAALDPSDAATVAAQSAALLKTGHPAEAVTAAAQAVALAPWDPDVRIAQAAALLKAGRVAEGRQASEQAARLQRGSSKVLGERLGGLP